MLDGQGEERNGENLRTSTARHLQGHIWSIHLEHIKAAKGALHPNLLILIPEKLDMNWVEEEA